MRGELTKSTFCILFLTIFLMKVMISLAPFLSSLKCDGTVSAVITQLEIEDSTEKSGDKIKESSTLKEYCTAAFSWSLDLPANTAGGRALNAECRLHVQSFYPPVPTPPPNFGQAPVKITPASA